MPFKPSVELSDLRAKQAATIATNATKTPADVSPEVFAGGPPMIAPDMPDWEKFCGHYPHCDEVNCPHYEPEKDCWCWLWEACYPGVVRWYSWDEAMQYVQDLEEKICLKS